MGEVLFFYNKICAMRDAKKSILFASQDDSCEAQWGLSSGVHFNVFEVEVPEEKIKS